MQARPGSARISARPFAWMREVSRYQWLVLAVAWLGWVFDSMDISIHAVAQEPAMRELSGA